MLTIFDRPATMKNSSLISRRNFIRIGGLAGAAGLSLPRLLAQEAVSGQKRQKSVIMIYLVGGPPHLDMWDLKPNCAERSSW